MAHEGVCGGCGMVPAVHVCGVCAWWDGRGQDHCSLEAEVAGMRLGFCWVLLEERRKEPHAAAQVAHYCMPAARWRAVSDGCR